MSLAQFARTAGDVELTPGHQAQADTKLSLVYTSENMLEAWILRHGVIGGYQQIIRHLQQIQKHILESMDVGLQVWHATLDTAFGISVHYHDTVLIIALVQHSGDLRVTIEPDGHHHLDMTLPVTSSATRLRSVG